MFARVRETISNRAAVTRGRPLRRRLKGGATHPTEHAEDQDMDNASVHSTITVETMRTPTNENRKPTANPNLRPLTQVFCGISDDPSLEATEVLERAQSDITKLSIYMQQTQFTRPVTAAFMGLVRGDNRSWEAIAVDILRQKARWENITLEDCEGEYLDTILAFLFHLDNCAFIHLSNLLLSANGAWTLQSIVFCRNLSKLQLDLIDLSFAMPMLCRGLKNNMSLQCLIASRCGLNDDRLHELFTSLPKQLQELRIFGNKCREKGLAAITSVVHHSQHLKILDMSYQHVDTKNPNDGEFDVSWLAGALHHNKVLKVLDLDNDGIDDGHLTHLCAALCSNDTLEELMLNHNLITATGITLLSSKFGEMKGLKKISMYSNLFDAPEVDALVTENLQPTPREVEPVEEDDTSDLEDEFDEEIDYEEEIIVEESGHDIAVEDDDDEDSSEGEMMSDDSSTPPPSADFREPEEAMDDSLPGEQDSDDEADEGNDVEGEDDENDNYIEDEELQGTEPTQATTGEASQDDDSLFLTSQFHVDVPEKEKEISETKTWPVQQDGEMTKNDNDDDEKQSSPEATRAFHESSHQHDDTEIAEINNDPTIPAVDNSAADETNSSQNPQCVQGGITTSVDSPLLANSQESMDEGGNGAEGAVDALVPEDGDERIEGDDIPSLPLQDASEKEYSATVDENSHQNVADTVTGKEYDTQVEHDTVSKESSSGNIDQPDIFEPFHSDERNDESNPPPANVADSNKDETLAIKDANDSNAEGTTNKTKETILDGLSAQVESTKELEPMSMSMENETNDVGEEATDEDAHDDSQVVAPSSELPTVNDNNQDGNDSKSNEMPDVNDHALGEVKATTHLTDETIGDDSSTMDAIGADDKHVPEVVETSEDDSASPVESSQVLEDETVIFHVEDSDDKAADDKHVQENETPLSPSLEEKDQGEVQASELQLQNVEGKTKVTEETPAETFLSLLESSKPRDDTERTKVKDSTAQQESIKVQDESADSKDVTDNGNSDEGVKGELPN